MNPENQYEVLVKNGEVQSEEGYFYKAGSFNIKTESHEIIVEFKQGPAHNVVYSVQFNGNEVYQLSHPHYVPEVDGALPKSKDPVDVAQIDHHLIKVGQLGTVLMAAMVHTGIVGDKQYIKHFKDSANLKAISFQLTQPKVKIAA